jgi:UMF1 family MFS transporter
MSGIEIDASATQVAGRKRLSNSALSWAVFEGGRDTYVILVMALAFMPYFVTTVVGDPVRGQALAAGYAKFSGLAVALTAPILGAMVDRLGPRKPWLAASGLAAAVLTSCLWIARPGADDATIHLVLTMTTVLGVLIAYTDVFHNSMMPYAAAPAEQARASGLALSLGNLFGLVMIVFMLWGFSLPGVANLPFLPSAPLFGLDRAEGDHVRIVGPLVGLAIAVGILPLLLFSRDAPRTAASLGAAARAGVLEIWTILRHARMPRDAALFLLGRMLYSDAKIAGLMFGGIYAAGVMKWGAPELLMMGLLATASGVFGGILAGWLDTTIGPRRALILEILVAIGCLFTQLGITRETLFYLPASAEPLWSAPLFNTAPQLAYLGVVIVSSIAGVAAFSSSRTMLTAVAPKDNIGAFFGLYALSGAATAWLGPLLVEAATRTFGSQQAGMAPIALLLAAGAGVLCLVKGGRAPAAA